MRARFAATVPVVALLLVLPLLVACGGSSKKGEAPPPGDLSVTSVTPERGSMAGGYRAQVRGSGFSGGVTSLTFGGVPATDVSASGDTTLNCTVPASGDPGPVDIAVTTAAGTATLEAGFRYNDPPRVFFVQPYAGWPGTTVSVVGLGFSNYDAGPPTVLFGTQQSLTPQVVNDNVIFATVPPSAGARVVDVTVTNDNGTGTARLAFIYLQSSFSTLSALLPKAEDDPEESVYAVVADLEARVATGYALSAATGFRWAELETGPLEVEIR